MAIKAELSIENFEGTGFHVIRARTKQRGDLIFAPSETRGLQPEEVRGIMQGQDVAIPRNGILLLGQRGVVRGVQVERPLRAAQR